MTSKVRKVYGDIIVRYMDDVQNPCDWMIYKKVLVCLSNDKALNIEEGFVTDFASVPRIFWSIIAPIGHYNLAALIHDYIYTTHIYDRKFADNEFLIWLDKLCPNNKIRNRAMFLGVRLFGWTRWNKFYKPD